MTMSRVKEDSQGKRRQLWCVGENFMFKFRIPKLGFALDFALSPYIFKKAIRKRYLKND